MVPFFFTIFLSTYIELRTVRQKMKTTIEIDDQLLAEAQKLCDLKNKTDTVELALKTLVRLKKQESTRRLRGQLTWDGNLDGMRSN